MKKLIKFILSLPLIMLGIGLQAWSFGVLYYCLPLDAFLRMVIATAYVLAVISLVIFSKKRARAFLISLLGYCVIVAWFGSIKPEEGGLFPPELAMPHAKIEGDKLTMYNVRNCNYRTKDDFDVKYETRTYDLRDIQSVDMLVNYWGIESVAHTFLSYGFSDGRYLCVSVEIRPEVGQSYGELKGLFKQYQLIYIWADERDLIRLRTNYKGEDVYLYRTRFSHPEVKKLFLSMVESTNAIYKEPFFYNTATHSCTNTIGHHINASGIYKIPWYKRRLLTGTVDERAYDADAFITSMPFAEFRKDALIDDRARAADKNPDFSKKIRTHLQER